jgi:hypothetical protein
MGIARTAAENWLLDPGAQRPCWRSLRHQQNEFSNQKAAIGQRDADGSIWLSVLWQPASHTAAHKCHTPWPRWPPVLRRPASVLCLGKPPHMQPAAVAFATAVRHSNSSAKISWQSRPSPPMCLAIALSRATLKHFTGSCTSGRISGNQCKPKPASEGQKSKIKGRSACSPRPLLRSPA